MKLLILAMTLISGFNSNASTLDEYTLPLSALQSEENFVLNATQTKIEYRQETVSKNCSRKVAIGYEQSCDLEPITKCETSSNGKQFGCKTVWETQCAPKPKYQEETYICSEIASVAYEVFNNNTKALVNVKLANSSEGTNFSQKNCDLNFRLNGNDFYPSANCSDFIVIAPRTKVESRDGDTIIQDHKLNVSLLDAKIITAPVKNGIKEMRVEDQYLVFKTGDLTKNKNFSLKLFVENKSLKGATTLINRNLAPQEYTFEKTSDETGIVKIDLANLISGIKMNKKHMLKVDIKVLTNITNSINTYLPALSASEAIIIND